MITREMLRKWLNDANLDMEDLLLEIANDDFKHSQLLTMNVNPSSKRGNLAEDIML